MKREIKIFTAGCPACEPTVKLLREMACASCDITIIDVSKADSSSVRSDLERYGISRLPSVVVNGELLDCCKSGEVKKEDLIEAGIGNPRV